MRTIGNYTFGKFRKTADKSFGHFLAICFFFHLECPHNDEHGYTYPTSVIGYFPSSVRYYHFVTLKIKNLQKTCFMFFCEKIQHVFYPYCNVQNQVTVDAVYHPNIPVVKNLVTRVQSNCTNSFRSRTT